jgi:hypothetical protein
MKPDFNPIIQEQTSDTLAHVSDILAFMQTFFASSDLPSTDYEKSIHVGIYCVLDVARRALLYEKERLNQIVPGGPICIAVSPVCLRHSWHSVGQGLTQLSGELADISVPGSY